MTEQRQTRWLEAFVRESGIRSSLIVHGNVQDLCRDQETLDYEPIRQVMIRSLRRRGFDDVAVWDRVDGVQNLSPQSLEDLRRQAVEQAGTRELQGEAYDLGDDSAAPSSPSCGAIPLGDPQDFFSTVLRAMLKPGLKKYAFILDFSHYLFGNTDSLSEKERVWLITLSKAVRGVPALLDAQSITKPSNAVILVCNNIGAIPPSYYQGNPSVREIVVPQPDRGQREEFLKRHLNMFPVDQPLGATDPRLHDVVDMLDGLTFCDMRQLIKLSHQCRDRLTFDKLITLYKYGEQDSPWETLKKEKLTTIESRLKEWVKGQDRAVKKVEMVIKRAYTGLAGVQVSKNRRAPKGVLFFVGPTGVGKTELAKALARFLFGDEEACVRFDMSEFNHEQADQRLIGAPPGYVGYGSGGELTNAVKRRPFSVLLFDEIEKAHGRILDKFLQILEDGRLTDSTGQTAYFSETVIIFTSNIGASDVTISDDPEATAQQFKDAVRNHFLYELKRPELLNRLGENIVPFNFITDPEVLMQIVRVKLRPLKETLKEKYGITDFAFADEARALHTLSLVVDRSNGGHGIVNELVPRIIDPLAEFLFETEEDPIMYSGRKIRVIQAGNTANFDFELE